MAVVPVDLDVTVPPVSALLATLSRGEVAPTPLYSNICSCTLPVPPVNVMFVPSELAILYHIEPVTIPVRTSESTAFTHPAGVPIPPMVVTAVTTAMSRFPLVGVAPNIAVADPLAPVPDDFCT